MPFDEEGDNVLLMLVGRSVHPSVCPSVDQMFPTNILNTFYQRTFIFQKLIGLGNDKNPIAFGFTRSKVKVTRVTFVKKTFSAKYLKNYLTAEVCMQLAGVDIFRSTKPNAAHSHCASL